jgi:hypothetical protein
LTFDQLSSKVFLVRIEHYFELNEDATYSNPVQVDLQILFHSLGSIVDLVELTLGANLPLNELQRLVWKTTDNQSSYSKPIRTKTKDIFTLNSHIYFFFS